MAFELYKGPNGSANVATEVYIASGAVTVGKPVKLAAGASGATYGKVATIAGASDSADLAFGVPIHSAVDGAEVLVVPILPGQRWIVDAAADTNVSNVAAANYLAATTLLLTVGAATNQGQKCVILGQLGAAADRKYICQFYQPNVLGG